jgi:hypothetical protein
LSVLSTSALSSILRQHFTTCWLLRESSIGKPLLLLLGCILTLHCGGILLTKELLNRDLNNYKRCLLVVSWVVVHVNCSGRSLRLNLFSTSFYHNHAWWYDFSQSQSLIEVKCSLKIVKRQDKEI